MTVTRNITTAQKELVILKYSLCRNNSDHLRLCAEAGILDYMRVAQLAHRLGGLTNSRHSPAYDPVLDDTVHLIRSTNNHPWDEIDDAYLRVHWPGARSAMGLSVFTLRVEGIAVFINRSVWDVATRARTLGLRHVPRYFDLRKVRMWLGLSFHELRELVDDGGGNDRLGRAIVPSPILALRNARGRYRIMLVSATALARALACKPELVERLIVERNADRDFIAEAIQGIRDIGLGRARFEDSPYIGYDSCSLSPLDIAFGRPLDMAAIVKQPELRIAPEALTVPFGWADERWTPKLWRELATEKLFAAARAVDSARAADLQRKASCSVESRPSCLVARVSRKGFDARLDRDQ